MPELFHRSYELTVSLMGIPGFTFSSKVTPTLDIDFNVVRTLTKEPNTAIINVLNLSPTNRGKLEVLKDAQVELIAGYDLWKGIIFKGDTECNNDHQFPNWITTFEADDGGACTQFDRVNISMPPGTTIQTAITALAAQMRVGIGNSVAAALAGNLIEGGQAFLNGVVMSGSATKQLNRLCKSSGLEWSIQNDALQLLPKGMPLPTTAVLLNEDTGLIGQPSVGNKGTVIFRSLLNKDIVPGGLVALESKNVTGLVRAEKCNYIGSSYGQDWYVESEGNRI